MLEKDDLRDAVLFECDLAIHLHGKVPQGTWDHRLTPGQRSTTELLRYLAFCGIGAARAMRDGHWQGYEDAAEEVAELAPEDFPAAMARQKEALALFFDELETDDLSTRRARQPIGLETSLGRALIDTTLKWLTAYRMQLFLHAKAAGAAELDTANCWAGVDRFSS